MKSYDSQAQQLFYQTVMGGGSNNIHYGLFVGSAAGDPSRIKEASQNTIFYNIDLMQMTAAGSVGAGSKVLELGSATGGAAFEIIKRYGCHVTGFNISPGQNATAEERAQELGLADNFTTFTGSFDEPWPLEWANSFDAVFSIDSLSYSHDKDAVLKKVANVLKPGGVIAFSDLLATEGGADEDREALARVLPGLTLETPSHHIESMRNAGIKYSAYIDYSRHLGLTYSAMKYQIDTNYDMLLAGGCTKKQLDDYRTSLAERLVLIDAGKWSVDWAAFAGRKLP